MNTLDLTKNKAEIGELNAGFVRSKMPADRRQTSNALAFLIFLATFAAYSATFWAIVFAPFWIIKLIAIPLNALLIGSLLIIGHDACHGSFTSNKYINQTIGRIAFFASLIPFSAWEVSHNQLHHGWTNFKQHDVYIPLSKTEYDSLSAFGRLIQRLYRTFFGVVFLYQIETWIKHLIFPRKSDFKRMNRKIFYFDITLVLVFLVFQIISLVLIAPYLANLLGLTIQPPIILILTSLILPYCISAWLYALTTVNQHTHPKVPWFDKKSEWDFFNSQVQSVVHMKLPKILGLTFLDALEHTAHHVDVKIPLYRLKKSQKALHQYFSEAITVGNWSFIQFYRNMKICKLYDYDNHCWMDFDGNPTSKRLLIK